MAGRGGAIVCASNLVGCCNGAPPTGVARADDAAALTGVGNALRVAVTVAGNTPAAGAGDDRVAVIVFVVADAAGTGNTPAAGAGGDDVAVIVFVVVAVALVVGILLVPERMSTTSDIFGRTAESCAQHS